MELGWRNQSTGLAQSVQQEERIARVQESGWPWNNAALNRGKLGPLRTWVVMEVSWIRS